jgi:hypothetical protein
MNLEHVNILRNMKSVGKLNNVSPVKNNYPMYMKQEAQNKIIAKLAEKDKLTINAFSTNQLATYDATSTIQTVQSPVIPTVTSLSMASKISAINQDRSNMSSAEVQARLKAISDAAASDDFTDLSDGEKFGIIYNRYIVNFGSIYTGASWTVNQQDFMLVRDQYQKDLITVFGDNWISNPADYYSELLGCVGMTPEEKQQHITAQYKNAGVPMSPIVYMHMITEMYAAGAIDADTKTRMLIELDIQVTNAAYASYYAKNGNLDGIYSISYTEFWLQSLDWDLLWSSMLSSISTDEGRSEEFKENLAMVISRCR